MRLGTATIKREKRARRHARVRAKIQGTIERPRFSVFRSHRHIWVQLIDDSKGHTVISANDKEIYGERKKNAGGITPMAMSEKVGEAAARKALEKKIVTAVFDRGGYRYHGIIKAVAEGARRGGLTL